MWEVGSAVRLVVTDAVPGNGMLGRGNAVGPSRSAHRDGGDENAHRRGIEWEDDADAEGMDAARAAQPALGVAGEAAPLLRCDCVADSRPAGRSVLHGIAILRHVFSGSKGAGREGLV